MATKRKSSPSSARPARKTKPGRPAGRARPASPARPAATKSSAVKPLKGSAKAEPKRAAETKKPAAKTKEAPKRPAGGVVAAPGKRPGSGTSPVLKAVDTPRATVRPLGVLPPQHQARSSHRPAPSSTIRSRSTAQAPAPTQETTPVTEPDLKQFEARLLDERRRILKEMGHLETTVLKVNPRDSAGDLSGYSFHMADAGTDAMEREKAFLFASTEGRALMEIDDALRRMYRGEYGACESCGQPIPRGRLEAVRLCIACKEKEERSQRGAP
jgi:RNA polymerase-binding transcription factor DksA